MSLKTIIIVRHGFRSNWSTDPHTGDITSSIPSPTGIASDPALSAYGVAQSVELGVELERRLGTRSGIRIQSSPFYRCIQTLLPYAEKALDHTGRQREVVIDPGVGEWYGIARFTHPVPADTKVLVPLFPKLLLKPVPYDTPIPSKQGESIETLYQRCARALSAAIKHADEDGIETLVICTHAAAIIAIGRVLTSVVPVDEDVTDFHTYTCGISRFERKATVSGNGIADRPNGAPPTKEASNESPAAARKPGEFREQLGEWICVENSVCGHLSNGPERSWHFSGDESFPDMPDEPDGNSHENQKFRGDTKGAASGSERSEGLKPLKGML
ncbi:hypothetical protein MMC25_002244 [Agyrium rufum]|nr:hypothetical protein [Agyrium rufum]